MIDPPSPKNNWHAVPIEIVISREFASSEAVLKACYWFSRNFACDIKEDANQFMVFLKPKSNPSDNLESIRDAFLEHVVDFELRQRVDAKTEDIRNVLLAKAFSESGVLEDAPPEGVFGDSLEESHPNGMFKILSNS